MVAFTKEVAVRFTLDNWHTTSEVACKHVTSLPSLPPPFPNPHTEGDKAVINSTWDRFSFLINLEDYERKLHEKTMWFVARYTVPGVGEWWDNNSGKNYSVGFKKTGNTSSAATDPARTSPVVGNSQQRTFSAPPTLKGTPTTEAVQAVVHGIKPQAPPGKITLPPAHFRSHRASMPPRPSPPIRHNSSPQPMMLSSLAGSRSAATALYASVPSKLNLMNYAAPTSTTPRQVTPTRDFVGLAEAGVPPEKSKGSVTQQMNIIGGMPATAPKYEQSWAPSNNSSTQSLSDSTPPPLYTALPSASELEKQRAKDIVSSPPSSLANDSTYAAFVKQWCFVQSPTPSPNVTPPMSGGSSSAGTPRPSAGSTWLDAFSGLYGGAGVRSDSPMLASM